MDSFCPAEGSHPQNNMAGQSRFQISELQFDNFTHTFNVFTVEDKIQNPSKCLQFSLGRNVMDQRSGDGIFSGRFRICEGEGDVVGVEAPLDGVAQVIFHGVQVVEVGVQVRVHQDRGVEEDGEGQVKVEREVGEVRERRTSWMTWREDEMRHVNDLSQE